MVLEALELLKGIQRRVRIIEMDHIANRHAMIFLVIEKTAAARAGVEWPTERMQYLACAVARGVDAPQLFEADTELLHLAAAAQVEARLELFRERAARALGDQRVFGVQFHAGGVAGLVTAILRDAEVARDDALQEVIVARLREDQIMVLAHGGAHRRAALAPVGDEFVERDRVDHRARKDVCADLRALFQYADADFFVRRGGELLQSYRCGETGRTRAHYHDVVGHYITLHVELFVLFQGMRGSGISSLRRMPEVMERHSARNSRRPAV